MNLDEVLHGLGDNPKEAVDIEAGRERLRAAARRLHDDPLEAQRIDKLAKRIDRYEHDYQLAREALDRQNFGTAERYLRRAAQHGNDEAAYWLALVLQRHSIGHRLRGRLDKADKCAAEARGWHQRAEESGIAEALEDAAFTDIAAQPAAHAQSEPQGAVEQERNRPIEDAAAPPAQQAPSRGEDGYAIGIELQPYQFTAVLVGAEGQILSDETGKLPSMEPGAVIRALASSARNMVASKLGREFPATRVAFGVQLGGPVDTEAGTVHYYSKHLPSAAVKRPEFHWESFPLGPRLQDETGYATAILNDTVAFAERERWLGVGQQTGDFVVMLIREGVGGAVVSNGEHFKGPVEIGNFRCSGVDDWEEGDTHQYGILELDGGVTGIVRNASKHAEHPITDLQAAADAADEDGPRHAASRAFLSAGIAIARGLSYLVQFAGPSHVVLYAPEVMINKERRGGRVFLGQVSNFKEAVAFEAFRHCDLALRPIGPIDGAQGAALAALNRCFRIPPAPAAATTTRTGAMR